MAQLQGQPLIHWAVQRLRRNCVQVAVNTRAGMATLDWCERQALPVVTDRVGDAAGPLAGIKAALQWASDSEAGLLAVSPCDAPGLPDDLYSRLLTAAGTVPHQAAIAVTAEGQQPMCSVWPVSALPTVEAALQGGAHPPIWKMLEQLSAVPVYFEETEAFTNINTTEDLARWSDRLYQNQASAAKPAS